MSRVTYCFCFCSSKIGRKEAKKHKKSRESTELKKAQTVSSKEQQQQTALPQLLLQDSERGIVFLESLWKSCTEPF